MCVSRADTRVFKCRHMCVSRANTRVLQAQKHACRRADACLCANVYKRNLLTKPRLHMLTNPTVYSTSWYRHVDNNPLRNRTLAACAQRTRTFGICAYVCAHMYMDVDGGLCTFAQCLTYNYMYRYISVYIQMYMGVSGTSHICTHTCFCSKANARVSQAQTRACFNRRQMRVAGQTHVCACAHKATVARDMLLAAHDMLLAANDMLLACLIRDQCAYLSCNETDLRHENGSSQHTHTHEKVTHPCEQWLAHQCATN